jgi:hypothetical protein
METKYIVNNLSGQTLNGDLTINGDVIITGTTNIKPYKVYTALLTQSGGSDIQSVYAPNTLTIGVTYQIIQDDIGCDFTNVGSPNNSVGTYFVATGITPNSWGDTSSAALEYNTGAPVATVLENTIGNVWFEYNNVGEYYVKSNVLFTTNKTLAFGSFYNPGPQIYFYINNSIINENEVFLQTGDPTSADGYLSNTPIEIRVYN